MGTTNKGATTKRVVSRTIGAFVAAVVSCSAGVLALPAYANETTNVTQVSSLTELTSAISATDPGVIELTGDIDCAADKVAACVVVNGKDVTLDLNGHSITNDATDHTVTVNNGGELTLTNNTEATQNGVVDNTGHGKAALFVDRNSGATIENGVTLTRSNEAGTAATDPTDPNDNGKDNGNSYYTVLNHGTITMNGGTIKNSGGYSSVIDNGWFSDNQPGDSATFTMNGGTISGGKYVKNDTAGTMVINGGTIENGAAGNLLNWNKTTINGGTFIAADTSKPTILVGGVDDDADQGIVTIKGGDFTKAGTQLIAQVEEAAPAVSISGGEFAAAPDAKYLTEPTIVSDSLPGAMLNTEYNATLKVSPRPFDSVTAENLPGGLTIDPATGVISGTPTKSGEFTVKFTATNSKGTATKSFAMYVYEAPASDVTALPTGKIGTEYNYTVAATGYTTPTFAAEGLPAGLSIDAATGVISGTPTEYGSFTPKITLTNEGGTLTLTPTLEIDSPLSLDQTELAPAEVSKPYSAKLTFKGNPAASSSSVTGLPTGLDYDPATGTISGTPTKSGVFELTVAASNGVDPAVSTKLTLTVNAAPVVNTAALADATYAVDYSQKIDVAAYPAAKVEVSGLPEGLAYNAETGAVEGKPAVAGEFTVTVKASNDYGEVSRDLHLLVKGTPVISTTQQDVKPATVGSEYSLPLTVTGSPAPQIDYTTLPAGLSFDTQTNTVKGTVTAAPRVYPVTFTAKNSEGSASVTLSIRVNEKPVFKTQSLPDGSTLSEYKTEDGKDVQVVAEGLDVTFASKDLPAGLSLDAKTGVISGTPSKGGELSFTVTATNELGSTDQRYAIKVSEPAAVSTQSLAPVVAGQAYEQKIETTGYPAATVEVEGLPEGLSFQDGTISGTVAADKVKSYQVTVTANNKVGDKPASKTFTLYVATQPTIGTESLADAVAGSKYSIDLDVQGAPDLDVTVDGLPDGVTYYAPTKTISGFPTKAGEYPVTVTAMTAGGQLKASKEYTLRVTAAASIVTESLKDGLAGQAYDQAIETAGFPDAEVTVEGLPDGLSYKDGKITGTPKAAGTSQVTVTASNGVGEKAVKTFKLTVNEAPVISTESLAAAQTGVEYSADVTVTGTPAPKVDVSGLPAGLEYKDGKIAGTPTKSGEFTVVVSATNGTADPVTRELKLTVNAPASIATDALVDGIAGQEYAQPIETAGFPAATVTVEGLPDGLSYKDGKITGTPKAAGTATVTVKASNGIGDAASKTLTLTVNETPAISTESLAAATIDTPYDADVTVTGTPAADVTVSGLPAGLSYADGKITGTPTESGEFTVTVKASNKAGSVSKDLKLTVNAPASIETGSLVDGTVGQAYTQSILTSGFPAATVTVEGLPEGLGFDAVSNTITGTPKAAGTATVTVTASNGIGEKVVKDLKLTVNAPASIVTDALADGIAGQEYAQPVETAGFPAAEVTVEGLPDGLSYKDGQIAGTPKAAGTYTVTVKASNGIGDAASKTLTLTVNETPAISTESLAAAQTGAAYSADVTVTGTPAADVTVSGLPAGLSYADGKITGTPTESGEFTVTVKASNKAGSVSKDLKLTVNAPASIETGSLVDGTVGQTYTQSILTSGFPAATVTVEGLPEGLEFDAVSNAITGTPKTAGTATVTVTASNGIGEKVVKDLKLTVNAPASIVTESLADGIVGQAYSQKIETAGFPAATVVVSGLPEGLSYADGQITGTPATAGTATVTVTASNGIGDSATKELKLTVNEAAAVTTTELPAATQYTAYSADITATGSPAPSVTVEGDLPAGLTYADGKIQGTPTQTGEFKLMVKAGNGVAADATQELTLTVAAIPAQTVYRVYNPVTGEHLFTTDQNEYDQLAKVGWQQEGSSWRYLEKSDKPIWRLYNPNGGVHHYTTDQNEYDQLAKVGWVQEGVAGYAADESFGVAVHRLYNPNDTTGAHHFTLDENEVNSLVSAGWVDEGTAFYALPAESATDTTDTDATDTDTENTDTDTTDTDATDTDDTKVTE